MIEELPELKLQRVYCMDKIEDLIEIIEMHGFSDASELDFGCCIYLKFVKRSGEITISFVTAKSQLVSKKKTSTIHRLELMGNFMLSKLVVNVSRALGTDEHQKSNLLERFPSLFIMD